MKILHIGDMAGIAAIMSNECNKLGHKSEVLQLDTWDTFRIGEYYKNTTYAKSKSELRALVVRKINNYDHMVIHDLPDFAEDLDGVALSYVFHGNMLRNSPKLIKRVENIATMENIFVTTTDLLSYSKNTELLIRPVDRTLFKKQKITSDEAVTMISERYYPYLKKHLADFDIDIIVRDNYKVAYREMPEFLAQYGVYVDLKYQNSHPPKIIKEMSSTGLQALACGLTVYDYNQKAHTKFPLGHSGYRTAKEFIRILSE